MLIGGLLLLPVNLFLTNLKEYDKRNYYFPLDFAYNCLSSCERNGVLFTNGDNDSYPLWYLQNVEGYRTDVTVANVHLLNLPFYLDHLSRREPPFVLEATFDSRVGFSATPLDTPIEIRLNPPDQVSNADTLRTQFAGAQFGNETMLRAQDKVILSFLKANRWKRPVYFALTVAPSNLLGLEEYLSAVGIVRKLTPVKNQNIQPNELERNLESYEFRNFDDPSVHIEHQIPALYNNFRHGFIQLAAHYLEQGDRAKAQQIFEAMQKKLPQWRFADNQNAAVRGFGSRLGNAN